VARVIPIAAQSAAPSIVGRDPGGPRPADLPLSLYVHVPWCRRKCPYCDFNSHTAPAGLPEQAFLAALTADLEAALPAVWGRRIGSVFIGGGTPGLLSVAAVDRLLMMLRARLPLAADAEITLEANPGAVEVDKYGGFRAAGVTRLSLGVQSFDDRQLALLGRIHDAAAARRAIGEAARHFETFNIDLMYGLPGQDVRALLADLEAALSFAPPHLSCYQLTIEPNTPFAANPPAGLPDDDAAAALSDALEARLSAAGLAAYETSAYATPGHRCRHNLNYWQFGDYLGIGPGAHGKLTLADRVVRELRWKSPRDYLARAASGAVQRSTRLDTADLRFEFLMNALRLADGFAIDDFERRSGAHWDSVAATAAAAAADGLLCIAGGRVRPTAAGRRLLNALLLRFLP
jgi:putative oxygen-independent coproporphyrinogen III oxidase